MQFRRTPSFAVAPWAVLVLVALAAAPSIASGCANAVEETDPDLAAGGASASSSSQGSVVASTSTTSTSSASSAGGGGGNPCGDCPPDQICKNGQCVTEPCALPASVGDPACVIFEILQQNIGSNGFDKPWRGQDLVFGGNVLVTGLEFETNESPCIDEIRLMTGVANLSTLASSTVITSHPKGFTFWQRAAFSAPVPVPGNVEHTVWFHLFKLPNFTVGADVQLVSPSFGGHHTSNDPAGQAPGVYPEWNYEYGTNVRVYGAIF